MKDARPVELHLKKQSGINNVGGFMVKRLRLKKPFDSIGRVLFTILLILFAIFLFYRYEIHTIKVCSQASSEWSQLMSFCGKSMLSTHFGGWFSFMRQAVFLTMHGL